MSNATTTAGNTVKIGRTIYTVEKTGRDGFPYNLVGPRGGVIMGVRNVHTKRVYLMQGSRTLREYITDINGEIILHGV